VLPFQFPVSPPDPLQAGRARSCSCLGLDCPVPALHPVGTLTGEDATTDVVRVAAWWVQIPWANIATVTGQGVDVIDVFTDGQMPLERILAWLDRRGAQPGPVLAPNGHCLQFLVRPAAGWAADAARTPVGELGHPEPGAPVLLPPSRTIDGTGVRWLRPFTTIEVLPHGRPLFDTLRHLPDLRPWIP
jgi:hypothetical protein